MKSDFRENKETKLSLLEKTNWQKWGDKKIEKNEKKNEDQNKVKKPFLAVRLGGWLTKVFEESLDMSLRGEFNGKWWIALCIPRRQQVPFCERIYGF